MPKFSGDAVAKRTRVLERRTPSINLSVNLPPGWVTTTPVQVNQMHASATLIRRPDKHAL